jgi:hypothetical protein
VAIILPENNLMPLVLLLSLSPLLLPLTGNGLFFTDYAVCKDKQAEASSDQVLHNLYNGSLQRANASMLLSVGA